MVPSRYGAPFRPFWLLSRARVARASWPPQKWRIFGGEAGGDAAGVEAEVVARQLIISGRQRERYSPPLDFQDIGNHSAMLGA